jgi:hypothetical protein
LTWDFVLNASLCFASFFDLSRTEADEVSIDKEPTEGVISFSPPG